MQSTPRRSVPPLIAFAFAEYPLSWAYTINTEQDYTSTSLFNWFEIWYIVLLSNGLFHCVADKNRPGFIASDHANFIGGDCTVLEDSCAHFCKNIIPSSSAGSSSGLSGLSGSSGRKFFTTGSSWQDTQTSCMTAILGTRYLLVWRWETTAMMSLTATLQLYGTTIWVHAQVFVSFEVDNHLHLKKLHINVSKWESQCFYSSKYWS